MDRHQKVNLNLNVTVSRPGPETQRLTKKRKCGVSIDSLSHEELEVVARAASILKVSVPDIPAALNRLTSSHKLGPSSGKSVSDGNRRTRRKTTKGNTTTMAREYPSPPVDDPEKAVPLPRPADSDSIGSGCVQNYFGFDLVPQRWSDCFASLAPYSAPMVEQDFGSSTSPYITQSTLNREAAVDPSYLSTSPLNISQPGYGAVRSMENPGFQPAHDPFACDDPYEIAQFLQAYPTLQPTIMANTQPPLQQVMTYNNVTYDMNELPSGFAPTKEENSVTLGGSELSDFSSSTSDHETISMKSPPKPSRRGAFQDPQNREQTARTRKLKACLRCRMQKIRCEPDPNNPHGACFTCRNVTLKLSKLPCLRYKLADVKMFHLNPAPGRSFTARWSYDNTNDMSTWDLNSAVDVIKITQDYISKPLSMKVRRFVPIEGDILHRSWFDNKNQKKKLVMLPPYALVDLGAAEKEYFDHINQGGAEFFYGLLDPSDKFLWFTYSMAITRANNPQTPEEEQKVLKSVLRLWVAVRLMTRSQHIIGENTLGLPKDLIDESSPMHGKIPIPPIMSSQLNAIIIHKIQVPLRKKVLESLQALIHANKPSAWFTIYLCIFILLHNCTMLTQFEEWYARKHGRKTRYFRMDMVAEYHLGALILLAYFHYCCKGHHPFVLDWDATETTTMAELDIEQIQFIKRSAAYVKQNEARYKDLRTSEKYEDDHFFIAQLYEEDWVPRTTSI